MNKKENCNTDYNSSLNIRSSLFPVQNIFLFNQYDLYSYQNKPYVTDKIIQNTI